MIRFDTYRKTYKRQQALKRTRYGLRRVDVYTAADRLGRAFKNAHPLD